MLRPEGPSNLRLRPAPCRTGGGACISGPHRLPNSIQALVFRPRSGGMPPTRQRQAPSGRTIRYLANKMLGLAEPQPGRAGGRAALLRGGGRVGGRSGGREFFWLSRLPLGWRVVRPQCAWQRNLCNGRFWVTNMDIEASPTRWRRAPFAPLCVVGLVWACPRPLV